MSRASELRAMGEIVMMGRAVDMNGNNAEASQVIDYILSTLLGESKDVSGQEVIDLANKYHEGEPMKVRHITAVSVGGMRLIGLCLDDPSLDEDFEMPYDMRLAEHYVFSYCYNVDMPIFSALGDVYMEKTCQGYWHRVC